MKPSQLLLASFVLFYSLRPVPCGAHNVGAGLFGHTISISIDAGRLLVDYTIEVPASILIRMYRELLQDRDSARVKEIDSVITSQQIGLLERGLLFLWDGHEVPVVMKEGIQEKTGFGDYNFFQYRLRLEGALPEGDRDGELTVINRNYRGFAAVYFVSLSASSPYRIRRSSIQEPNQRFLIDSKTGRAWSLWEGLRSIRVEVGSRSFWDLGGGRERVAKIDLQAVYEGQSRSGRIERAAMGMKRRAGGSSAGIGRLKGFLMGEGLRARMLPLALGLAFFLGAAHALSPGHGKALVAAYLVGTRGSLLDPVILGAVVTFSHVFSVILLGLLTLWASQRVMPERLFPYLEAASAVMILVLGAWMLRTRWPSRRTHNHGGKGADRANDGSHHHPSPAEGHRHLHGHCVHHGDRGAGPLRSRGSGGARNWKELVYLGFSGGMIPCPSALVILLLALAVNKVAIGIGMILAFSMGLALVLISVGLMLVWTRSRLQILSEGGLVARWLPVGSSLVVLGIGVLMTGRVLWEYRLLPPFRLVL